MRFKVLDARSKIALCVGFLAILAPLGYWLFWAKDGAWIYHHKPQSIVSIGAELFFLDASRVVQRGPSKVVVLRFDKPVEFVPHYYRDEQLLAPLAANEWARHLKAKVVFNPGQYDENLMYLGWLKSNDVWLSKNMHADWSGLLLSGPKDGGVWARVVDIEQADASVVHRYRHAMQSMMLFDDAGRIRVRRSDLVASRTAIAEDKEGRIVLVLTEGALTLYDFAQWLLRTELDLLRAMNLDGGNETQLAIDTPELKRSFYGQYGTGDTFMPSAARSFLRYPLPAVVEVRGTE